MTTCSSKHHREALSCWGTQRSAPPPRGCLHSAPWGCWWESEHCHLSASRRHTGRTSGNARQRKAGRPVPAEIPDGHTLPPPAGRWKTPGRRRRSLRGTKENFNSEYCFGWMLKIWKWTLECLDFNNKIWLAHLANLRWTVFSISLKIKLKEKHKNSTEGFSQRIPLYSWMSLVKS